MLLINRIGLSNVRAKIMLLSLIGIIGISAISGINIYAGILINRESEIFKKSQNVIRGILKVMALEEKYIISNNPEMLSEHKKYHNELRKAIASMNSQATDEIIKNLVTKIVRLEEEHNRIFQFIEKNINIINNSKEPTNLLFRQMGDMLNNIVDTINDEESKAMLYMGNTFDSFKADLRAELKDLIGIQKETLLNIQELMLFSDITKYKDTKKIISRKLEKKIVNVKNLLQAVDSKEFNSIWEKVEEQFPKTAQIEETLLNGWIENRDLMTSLGEKSSQVEISALNIASLSTEYAEKKIRISEYIRLSLMTGGILILSLLSFVLSQSIIKPINSATERLKKSSDQVFSMSEQIFLSGRSFSENSTGQVSSVEKISASSEKVSAMTKKNADCSNNADIFMKQVNQIVLKSGDSISQLAVSMDDISKAGSSTSKIVKTIDEIAFQTNLLALNAAIEAARAGNLGGGFAVVSDAVRNLAMRVTKAAKQSSELIDIMIKKVKDGSDMLTGTMNDFQEVIRLTAKAGEFVSEIAAVSNEQAERIGQINKAINEVERIIEDNVAVARESAATSELMKVHAEKLKEIVNNLEFLIHGSRISRFSAAETGISLS